MAQRQHQRPQQTGFRLIDFGGHGLLQFREACVERRARGGIQALQLLDALKDLGGDPGAERADAVQAEGMIAAERVLHFGHGFLKLIPGGEKELEGVMAQGEKTLGFAAVGHSPAGGFFCGARKKTQQTGKGHGDSVGGSAAP